RNAPRPGAIAPELVNAPPGRPDNAAHIGCRDQHREDIAQPPHKIVAEFSAVVVFDEAQQTPVPDAPNDHGMRSVRLDRTPVKRSARLRGLQSGSGVLAFQPFQGHSHDLVELSPPRFPAESRIEGKYGIEHFDQRNGRLVATLQFVKLLYQLVMRHPGFPRLGRRPPPPSRPSRSARPSRREFADVAAPSIVARLPCPPPRAGGARAPARRRRPSARRPSSCRTASWSRANQLMWIC